MNQSIRILAFNGSHRSEKGFTEIALKKFLSGAESENAQCEVLYPSKMNIQACDSCGKCMFESPGKCKYNDDMQSIFIKMEEADLIVFACPVYFDSMPSRLKKIIERLRSTLDANFEFRDGRTHHIKISNKKQKIILIFTAGNPERESFISISGIFNRIIQNMEWRLEGEFHFPASHLLVTNPERLSSRLEALFISGKNCASNKKISRELIAKANEDYIGDPMQAVQDMTKMILKIRNENIIKTGIKHPK